MARLFIQIDGVPASPRELNLGVNRVGRGVDNEVVIAHPSVSYHHCEFELGLDSLVLRDCGSTNGTFVNNQKVKEAFLEPGQQVRFGQVSATIEWHREQVIVPEIAAPRRAESVALANHVMSCHNHQTIPSLWCCGTCQQYFCSRCVRGVNIVGRPVHKLCPNCSGHVLPAPWAEGQERKKTLWGRVKKALSRTIRVR